MERSPIWKQTYEGGRNHLLSSKTWCYGMETVPVDILFLVRDEVGIAEIDRTGVPVPSRPVQLQICTQHAEQGR